MGRVSLEGKTAACRWSSLATQSWKEAPERSRVGRPALCTYFCSPQFFKHVAHLPSYMSVRHVEKKSGENPKNTVCHTTIRLPQQRQTGPKKLLERKPAWSFTPMEENFKLNIGVFG